MEAVLRCDMPVAPFFTRAAFPWRMPWYWLTPWLAFMVLLDWALAVPIVVKPAKAIANTKAGVNFKNLLVSMVSSLAELLTREVAEDESRMTYES
jgi:hypothetical protein